MKTTLKYENLLIIYDRENSRSQLIFRIRIFKNLSDNILTPITPALEKRIIKLNFGRAIKPFEPREFFALKFNPNNLNQKSRFKIIAPFLPGSQNFLDQAKEIFDLKSTECLEYKGENS